MSEAPTGWVDTTLGAVIELNYGKSLPKKLREAGPYKVYGSNGVVGFHKAHVTDAPAIVVGRKGSIGEVHFSDEPCFPIDTTYYVDRFDSVTPHFARYLLHSVPLREMNRATAIPGLNREDAYSLAIRLPPLPEQRRIVAKIDSLSGKSKRARDHLDHVPRLVEKYKQAVLAAAFRDGFGAANGNTCFDPRPLSAAIVSTFYGPRIAESAYVKIGVPTLRTTDMQEWGMLSPKNPPQVSVREEERKKWELLDGDLMVTRTGTIGRCALYEAKFGPALPSAYLIRVRLDPEIADPRFVLFFLLSQSGQQQLLDGVTAVAQPNINANAIRSVQLPLPPTELQRSLVRRIEHLFTWIDRLATEATSARKLIVRLDQAILAKAFRGELVPQDPNDEPASVLLDRIRSERASTAAAKPKHKAKK